jgi:hypothetical protein
MTKKDWETLVEDLPLDPKQKDKILELTPTSYIGLAEKLVEEI